MSEEKFTAKLDQAMGAVKEGFGKLTGDKSTEVEGKVDQLVGAVKEGIADAKATVDGLIKGASKHVDDLKNDDTTVSSQDANR